MKTIFLDRDGVVIQKAAEGEYVRDWSEVQFLPGSVEAIADVSRLGYQVIIITNQRGVATGTIQPHKLEEIHARMKDVIETSGGHLAGIYCCPHDSSEGCACRKPKPGMLLQAAKEHQLCLSECWMVGDAVTDITAGKRAGCKTALVTGSRECEHWAEKPDIVVQNLALAAQHIVRIENGTDLDSMSEPGVSVAIKRT